MDIETLYLELMGDINDALKSEAPPPEKIAMMRRAKLKAEERYAALCSIEQGTFEPGERP